MALKKSEFFKKIENTRKVLLSEVNHWIKHRTWPEKCNKIIQVFLEAINYSDSVTMRNELAKEGVPLVASLEKLDPSSEIHFYLYKISGEHDVKNIFYQQICCVANVLELLLRLKEVINHLEMPKVSYRQLNLVRQSCKNIIAILPLITAKESQLLACYLEEAMILKEMVEYKKTEKKSFFNDRDNKIGQNVNVFKVIATYIKSQLDTAEQFEKDDRYLLTFRSYLPGHRLLPWNKLIQSTRETLYSKSIPPMTNVEGQQSNRIQEFADEYKQCRKEEFTQIEDEFSKDIEDAESLHKTLFNQLKEKNKVKYNLNFFGSEKVRSLMNILITKCEPDNNSEDEGMKLSNSS